METPIDSQFANQLDGAPEKPQFLKILCILSFVACGLMILLYAIGTMALGVSEAAIAGPWAQIVQGNPTLEDVDPMEFFHQVGIICVYGLIANIFSLIGVIMMWKLEKMGFFLYAIAELATNFFSMNLDMGQQEKSYGGMIFMILVDLVFITMYFVNLKYMVKNKNNDFVQSGNQ